MENCEHLRIDLAGRAVKGTEYVGHPESTGKLRSYSFARVRSQG